MERKRIQQQYDAATAAAAAIAVVATIAGLVVSGGLLPGIAIASAAVASITVAHGALLSRFAHQRQPGLLDLDRRTPRVCCS